MFCAPGWSTPPAPPASLALMAGCVCVCVSPATETPAAAIGTTTTIEVAAGSALCFVLFFHFQRVTAKLALEERGPTIGFRPRGRRRRRNSATGAGWSKNAVFSLLGAGEGRRARTGVGRWEWQARTRVSLCAARAGGTGVVKWKSIRGRREPPLRSRCPFSFFPSYMLLQRPQEENSRILYLWSRPFWPS